jgi:hypothetical protein
MSSFRASSRVTRTPHIAGTASPPSVSQHCGYSSSHPPSIYSSLFFYARSSAGHAVATRPSNSLSSEMCLLSILRRANVPYRCRFAALAHRRFSVAATACTQLAARSPSGSASRSQWRCLLSPPPTSLMHPRPHSLAASHSADALCHHRRLESSSSLPRTATLFS